jgi:GT2 family glycosyltransferase
MCDKELSIIIVNYNTQDLLKNCLDSVIKNTVGVEYEIIVVDNGSSDGSVEMLKTAFPDVVVIPNKENLGFGRANNQGIKIAKGQNMLLLNSDTIILDDCIIKCLNFINDRNDAGIVGCKVLNSDRSIQYSCFHYPTMLSELIFITKNIIKDFWDPVMYYQYMKYWDHKTVKKVDCISGCFMMIKKEVFCRIGLLDESFFMYYEETEFCLRVKKFSDFKIYYLPESEIIHLSGKSSSGIGYNTLKYTYKSMISYLQKKYGVQAVRCFNFLCFNIWFLERIIFRCLSFIPDFEKKYEMLVYLDKISRGDSDENT